MAIVVSDGFGIVLRAVGLDYQTFLFDEIFVKNLCLVTFVTNGDKNKH